MQKAQQNSSIGAGIFSMILLCLYIFMSKLSRLMSTKTFGRVNAIITTYNK